MYRRHYHKQQAQQSHDTPLDKEDVLLHTDAIGLLEERRQVTGTTNGKDTLRRTRYPCQHTGQDSERQGNGDNRREPRSTDEVKVSVEAHQQALGQVDFALRDDNTEREGAQDENQYRNERTDKYGLRIVDRRIIDILHVDTAHLHTGIEEEDARCQHQVVEVAEIGEEIALEVELRMSATGEINNSQHHQQACRNDGAHQTANLRDLAYPRHPFQGYKGGQPINGQHDDQGI